MNLIIMDQDIALNSSVYRYISTYSQHPLGEYGTTSCNPDFMITPFLGKFEC